jgi:hypothetical protein
VATPPFTPIHVDPLNYAADPDALRAGDFWKWQREFPDYPSSGWSLQYILNSPTARFAFPDGSITASENGTGFDISVVGSATAAVAAGIYELYAVLTQSGGGGVQQTFALQDVRVDANIATAAGAVDTRSFVKRTLDTIEAAILGDTSAHVQEYEIHGRRLKYMDRLQLQDLRQQYKREYRAELIAKGEYAPAKRAEIVFRSDY